MDKVAEKILELQEEVESLKAIIEQDKEIHNGLRDKFSKDAEKLGQIVFNSGWSTMEYIGQDESIIRLVKHYEEKIKHQGEYYKFKMNDLVIAKDNIDTFNQIVLHHTELGEWKPIMALYEKTKDISNYR